MSRLLEKMEQLKTTTRLRPDQRLAVRRRLLEHLETHPVRTCSFIRQLWVERPYLFSFTKLKPMQFVAIIALVIALGGGGVSAAAERSRPGDTLYPVKVQFNEEVRAKLAFSAEGKTAWGIRRAERRLEEASALSAEGKLTGDARLELENKFKNSASRARAGLLELSGRGKSAAAAELAGNFEATLRAHAEVLGSPAGGVDGSAQAEGQTTLEEVRGVLNTIVPLRSEFESGVMVKLETPDRRTAAEGKIKAAARVMAEARTFIEKKKAALGVAATAQAEAKLTAAEIIHAEAEAKMQTEGYAEAFELAGKAIRAAHEAKTLVVLQADIQIRTEVDGGGRKIIPQLVPPSFPSGTDPYEVEANAQTEADAGARSEPALESGEEGVVLPLPIMPVGSEKGGNVKVGL